MTAANPLPQQDRSAEQRAHEPSMEEILASIRRIIADDHAFPAPRPAAAPEAVVLSPAPPPEIEVERAEVPHLSPEAAPVDFQTGRAEDIARAPEEQAPAIHVSAPEVPVAAPPVEIEALSLLRGSADPLAADEPAAAAGHGFEPAAEAPRFEPDAPLVSPATDAAVGSAFNALVASHFLQNSGMIADIAREMLRPMLKAWLDDNLPIMVERLVRVEIERVARGGR